MVPRGFPRTFYDRFFTFQGVKVSFFRQSDNEPLSAPFPLECNSTFLCATSFNLGRFLLANGPERKAVHIILPRSDPRSEWFNVALKHLCDWTRTREVTTAYTDHEGRIRNTMYAPLWEIGQKLDAPRYQNAVVNAFLKDWAVDPDKALELSGFEWLCERHSGLLNEGKVKDHPFLWFLARMIMWKAGSRYWTEVVEKRAFTGLKLAEWIQEKLTVEGNVWTFDPLAGSEKVEWFMKEDLDVWDGVEELESLWTLRINDA